MSKLILPMGEMPGVIRESVRDVLKARGLVIAHETPLASRPWFAYDALGSDALEGVLRELGNNITQALWSIDESLNDSAGGSPTAAGEERDGAGPPPAAPSRSGCTLSAADALAAGQTLRMLAHSGAPGEGTGAVLGRVGEWLVEHALTELAAAKGTKAA